MHIKKIISLHEFTCYVSLASNNLYNILYSVISLYKQNVMKCCKVQLMHSIKAVKKFQIYNEFFNI